MNHQPFRGWLLSGEELSTEQAQALRDHVLNCEACSRLEHSWSELEAVIVRSPLLEPASGFVERWQIRLVAHQQHQQRLRGWYIIGTTGLLVVSLMVLFGMQLWSLIQHPDLYLAASFDQLVGIISIFYAIQNFASSFSWPDLGYTLAGMVILFGLMSFMSVLWLATYRKFSMVRRQA